MGTLAHLRGREGPVYAYIQHHPTVHIETYKQVLPHMLYIRGTASCRALKWGEWWREVCSRLGEL